MRIQQLADAEFFYYPQAFKKNYLNRLKAEIDWKQEYLSFYGQKVAIPRLTAYYGDKPYFYSGLRNAAREFPEVVKEIMVEIPSSISTNSVLLNFYRSGKDSISWHSDDEKSLGENPVVVSISFGAERVFKLRHKQTKVITKIVLESGSLLIMGKDSQLNYEHCVEKTPTSGERINLTFRNIYG